MRYQSESSSLNLSFHFSRMKHLTGLIFCSLVLEVRAGFYSLVKFTKVRLGGGGGGYDT